MTYTLFEHCPTVVCGQTKGGASITCGHCGRGEVIPVNKVKRHGGDDSEIIERMVSDKFRRLGWKVADTIRNHRCPGCFAAIKDSAIRKKEEKMSEKVVSIGPTTPPVVAVPSNNKPMNSTSISTGTAPPPRPMTRDERYLIFKKIDEYYMGETVGYSGDWNDEKIAKDLGVPMAFVSTVREESFGPSINEHTAKVTADAKTLLADIRQATTTLEPMIKQIEPFMKQLHELVARSASIEKHLRELQ